VTQNYTGAWAKLIADNANFTGPTADSTQDGSDAITPMALTYTQNTDFNLVDSGLGTIEFEFRPDDDFNYDKDANSQVPPFAQDIDLVISDVTDGDGITTVAVATLEPLPPTTPVGTQVRFGRLRMENAFGSELSDLIMNYYIEFYDEIGGTPFWTLHDDVDTSIGFGEILEVPGNTAATAINPTIPLGKFEITLSAAMIDVTETITIPIDTSGEPWLQYDWDQVGLFDDNPSALATFGIFDGSPVQIYIQQIYQ
jgi:MSHA biogenesis protein MshQ